MLRVRLAGIAESMVGAAIALAPQASADGQDDNFLALLAQAGVPAHDNIPSVIDYGHQVCQALDGGESASAVVDTLANHGYGEDPSHELGQYHRTMVRFVRASVTAFCPGNQGKLASVARSSGKPRIALVGQSFQIHRRFRRNLNRRSSCWCHLSRHRHRPRNKHRHRSRRPHLRHRW